tara:strand:- start:97 stop:2322 length:2226 start_codon:yes stop_codon:yes gene_type:complete
MRILIFSTLFFLIGFELMAQDFLTSPSSNPVLFPKGDFFRQNEKSFVQKENFVYQFDTLSLPFIDDFSTNHFPKRITDINDPRVSDTTVYSIIINDTIYREPAGFTSDSSFRYVINPADSSIIFKLFLDTERKIDFHEISKFPTTFDTLTVFLAYDIYDTLNGGSDTLLKTPEYFADSAAYFIVEKNSNDYYTDRSVLLSNTYPIEPPSIGVATFDGLDEFGMAYDFLDPETVSADQLTSVPINLSNLSNKEVFFSFYYQPQGISLSSPGLRDSLVLDFFNASTQAWSNVWRVPGRGLDDFKQVIIRVPDSIQHNGFQFRFRNYANSTGSFDHWHIDYIYLNNNRSVDDTIYRDLAFVYDAPSLLKNYTAMPWFHFKLNPASFMVDDSVATRVVNNSNENIPVYNKITVTDTVFNTIIYQRPLNTNSFVIFSPFMRFDLKYPIDFSYNSNQVDSAGIFEEVYDVDFRPPAQQQPDFIRSNDTIIGKTVLKDYYAYDDGTAEAGYGVVPQPSQEGLFGFMALEFNAPIQDTIGGVQIYFLPQTFDVRPQPFELIVWNSLNPPNVIFRMPFRYNPIYTDYNAFISYSFDSLVPVNQTFYVGLKSIGPNSMNVGYDLNTNSRDKLFWSFDGETWNIPSAGIRDGSLMMRPIFRRTGMPVGLKKIKKIAEQIKIFPVPAADLINIEGISYDAAQTILIYDIRGQLVKEQAFEQQVAINELKNGVYILRIFKHDGSIINQKFIVSH